MGILAVSRQLPGERKCHAELKASITLNSEPGTLNLFLFYVLSIRIFVILTAILLVVLTGSTGYYLLFGGKHTFMDCLYMTVISLTTVGYGEVLEISGNIPAQIFSMILIIFGTGIILYGISTLTALIVEGEVSGILRRKG